MALPAAKVVGIPVNVIAPLLGVLPAQRTFERYKFEHRRGFVERAELTLACDNVFNTLPQYDPTYINYPYYSSQWFNPVGRSFLAEVSYKFGWPKK